MAVSINYRLEGKFFGLEDPSCGFIAQEDARAAVRFVRMKAADYNVGLPF